MLVKVTRTENSIKERKITYRKAVHFAMGKPHFIFIREINEWRVRLSYTYRPLKFEKKNLYWLCEGGVRRDWEWEGENERFRLEFYCYPESDIFWQSFILFIRYSKEFTTERISNFCQRDSWDKTVPQWLQNTEKFSNSFIESLKICYIATLIITTDLLTRLQW